MKVDTRLTVMKPLSAKWIISAYDHLCHDSGIVRGGFIVAGILETLNEADADNLSSS